LVSTSPDLLEPNRYGNGVLARAKDDEVLRRLPILSHADVEFVVFQFPRRVELMKDF
jgi:hypothetical protein